MHTLTRIVRFSMNPFLPETVTGDNSYACKPGGEGLALFFELGVQLDGPVRDDTGFIINVAEIDKAVRKYVIPVFTNRIKANYNQSRHVSCAELAGFLADSLNMICDCFKPASVSELTLKLNPFRILAIRSENIEVIYLSEKFEFAATHTLWNDDFTAEKNEAVFGKCANPSGHGHNYLVEVTIKMGDTEAASSPVADLEKTVKTEFITHVDHKNLNIDCPEFGEKNPTVENIAAFAWDKLSGKFANAELEKVTVWENDRTYCTYRL